MTATDQDVRIVSGDTVRLPVSVMDDSGNALNIAGASIEWVLAKHAGADPVITKSTADGSVALTDAEGGEFQVTVAPEDTADYAGTWYHEIELTDTDGNVSTILSGTFEIREDSA